MSYLTPEKNLKYLRIYHTSSKLLVPFSVVSFGLYQTRHKNISLTFNIVNVINFSFHSYVSTSCIISDYVKIKHIEPLIRRLNIGTHVIATAGVINILYKYNIN